VDRPGGSGRREGSKVKRLSYLLVTSFGGRALAVKRATENAGKETPGIDGELWDSPEKKAEAVARIEQWRDYQPLPLKRIYIPKKDGKQRPLSVPVMEDRARQALYLQALQPIAETQADRNSYGFRPKRRCADAIDQCFKVLRQKGSACWILEGDIQGFFRPHRFFLDRRTHPHEQADPGEVAPLWLQRLRCPVPDHGGSPTRGH
jgi:RNA-directed DNA polymerase